MITRRTLLKTLAGLFGAGVSGKLIADESKHATIRVESGFTTDEAKMEDIAQMMSSVDSYPLISVDVEQSGICRYFMIDGFDVLDSDGKVVEDAVHYVNERDGYISISNPSEDVNGPDIIIRKGNYRIVGLTHKQRLEHVRRFG